MKKAEITEAKQTVLMLAYLCIKSKEGEEEYSLTQKVEILDKFLLPDDDIAIICNCKNQAVRDARQRLKKKKK